MKKIISLALSALVLVVFAACGESKSTPSSKPTSTPSSHVVSSSAPSSQQSTTPDSNSMEPVGNKYSVIIEESRPEEYNDGIMYSVVTGPADKNYDVFFSGGFGFVEEDMEEYAISISLINVKAYGIAIIKPVQGKEQDVTQQLEQFVDAIQKTFENYLQDQYQIAKEAIVKQVETGEIVMVMCEDSQQIFDKIEAALAAE